MAYSQFSFIDISTYSFKGAQPNFNIIDSNCFYKHSNNSCEKVIINAGNATEIPVGLPQDFTPLHSIANVYFNKKDTGFMLTQIYNSSVSTQYIYSLYFTKDNGVSWLKLKSDSINFVVTLNYFDNNLAYFNAYNYKQTNPSQIYDMKRGLFLNDSNTAGLFLRIKEGVGHCLVINSNTNYNGKIATTNDGGKTFQILNNIDYSKIPFSNNQNGILQKICIATNDFWVAQYTYDSINLYQNTKLYYTVNQGTSWNVLFNFGVSKITSSNSSVVYVYKQNQSGGGGKLYQVSNNGGKVCLTDFRSRIDNMYFWNSDRGLIFSADTPNNQPGIWRVTNGGGAPCSIAGINDKKTPSNLITLYPNPANNQITLANYSLQVHSNYHIYNLLGTLVQQGNLEEKETTININSLAEGLYFIEVGDTTLKFVKGK